MATATQSLRMENHALNKATNESSGEIPRIDLANIDNVPYYIES